jgi:hypothetical protein
MLSLARDTPKQTAESQRLISEKRWSQPQPINQVQLNASSIASSAVPFRKALSVAYLPDMSDYNYLAEFTRPGTKAVGWLEQGHDFHTATPDETMLNALWTFCKVSVAQTRGVHPCPFCKDQLGAEAERDGESLLLGTSEIRVFSQDGLIFAAPTLIYHYISHHHYRPPTEFVAALSDGLRPGSPEYFALLRRLELEWNDTSKGGLGYWDPLSYDPESDDQTPLIDLMNRSKSK